MLIGKPDSGRTFDPAPSGGKSITLCDVVDLGMVETKWGDKDMMRMHYITKDKFSEEGRDQHYMVVERCTKSLYDGSGKSPNPSKLYTRIKALTGKVPQYDTEGKFDVESLIGKSAFANIVHNESDGKTYANIESLMPLPDGMDAPQIPADFVRSKDREKADDEAPF